MPVARRCDFTRLACHLLATPIAPAAPCRFLLQLGFLTLLPLVAEEWLEFGLRHAVSNFLRQQLSLRLLYTLFSERTRAVFYDRALQLGVAKYVATGRSFMGMTSNFTSLFKLYARSHLLYASDMTILLIAYAYYSRVYTNFPSTSLGYYGIYTLPIWVLVVGCAFSPWLVNPCELMAAEPAHGALPCHAWSLFVLLALCLT